MTTPRTQKQFSLDLIPHTYSGSLIQQRGVDGYINATSMCRAASKQWVRYRERPETADFLGALAHSLSAPTASLIQNVQDTDPTIAGTWVHPQIAIHLAQWLSAEFAVKVTEWVQAWMSGKDPNDSEWQVLHDRISLVYDNVPEGYFSIFQEIADLTAALITSGASLGTRILVDISVGLHWANHWNDNGLDGRFGVRKYYSHNYPSYFPQAASNPQPAACYPEDALPEFRRWMRSTYLPQKMPDYLKSQAKQKKLPAQLVTSAIEALTDRERGRAKPRLKRYG